MTVFNPTIHHRKSIRLKGYDYAQEGFYFITICCQDRAQLFGEIMNGEMILNECGEIAENCWLEIPNHFPNVELHKYVIMPNHVHGIIEIKFKSNVPSVIPSVASVASVGANNHSPLRTLQRSLPRSPSKTIGSIVRGFKIGVTKWMRQYTNVYDVWQRNYYDNIIRNEQSYQRIANYIQNNPKNWKEDKFYI
jgi:REP element-mobilizing transposase RayT